MTHVAKPTRNCHSLTHNATYGIFRGDILHRLGVNQKYGRTQVHVSHKHYAILYLHLEFVGRHQTERVPVPHKFNFHVNLIQQITILKEHVCVYATHHAHHATSVGKRRTLAQATVPSVLGEIDHIHVIRQIGIKQSRRQVTKNYFPENCPRES